MSEELQCTCGGTWPCSGPAWMGDHSPVRMTSTDAVLTWQPCGDDCHEMTAEHPAASQCGHCPPRRCEDCGGINDMATDRMCACWIDLRTLAPADVKALFAADGWDVGTDGQLTR